MTVFDNVAPENTDVSLKIAFKAASAMSTDVVLSTTTGAAAVRAAEVGKEVGFKGGIIAVTHAWGSRKSGENAMTDVNREKLKESGVVLVTAAHALSGAERALSGKFGGAYPVEIIAHTLRMFCQGMKVCVEIGAMALDAGALKAPRPIAAIGGTGRGLDTVCVTTPAYTANIFETRIHEVLCKPY